MVASRVRCGRPELLVCRLAAPVPPSSNALSTAMVGGARNTALGAWPPRPVVL